MRTDIGVYGVTAVISGFASFTTAIQTVISPADTWVPLGVVVTLFVVAMTATVKVVRLVDGIRRNQKRIMRSLDMEDE